MSTGEKQTHQLGNGYISTFHTPVPCPICHKPSFSVRKESDGMYWQHRTKMIRRGDKVCPVTLRTSYCVQVKVA